MRELLSEVLDVEFVGLHGVFVLGDFYVSLVDLLREICEVPLLLCEQVAVDVFQLLQFGAEGVELVVELSDGPLAFLQLLV